VLRHGRSAAYRAIKIGAGEPHVVRDDLGAAGPGSAAARDPGRALACLVHITDLQLGDVQSPTRFEFINARFADPRYAEIIPVQRPQEALTAHAVDAQTPGLAAAMTGVSKPVSLPGDFDHDEALALCTEHPTAGRTVMRSGPARTTGW
jgi:hypothetical protein